MKPHKNTGMSFTTALRQQEQSFVFVYTKQEFVKHLPRDENISDWYK